MSLPEVLLWRWLKNRGVGVRFRRPHPIGPYVIDFYCAELRLAIEIDGAGHDMGDRPERDERRCGWLKQKDVELVRIAAADVLMDVTAVAESIRMLCSERR
ncbi:MAG: DUF559 domain-containing protein [Sphingomonadales bacterium]|nr:MAG: DUF559 domain-containing protein [Sphingomonadales bacterium]